MFIFHLLLFINLINASSSEDRRSISISYGSQFPLRLKVPSSVFNKLPGSNWNIEPSVMLFHSLVDSDKSVEKIIPSATILLKASLVQILSWNKFYEAFLTIICESKLLSIFQIFDNSRNYLEKIGILDKLIQVEDFKITGFDLYYLFNFLKFPIRSPSSFKSYEEYLLDRAKYLEPGSVNKVFENVPYTPITPTSTLRKFITPLFLDTGILDLNDKSTKEVILGNAMLHEDYDLIGFLFLNYSDPSKKTSFIKNRDFSEMLSGLSMMAQTNIKILEILFDRKLVEWKVADLSYDNFECLAEYLSHYPLSGLEIVLNSRNFLIPNIMVPTLVYDYIENIVVAIKESASEFGIKSKSLKIFQELIEDLFSKEMFRRQLIRIPLHFYEFLLYMEFPIANKRYLVDNLIKECGEFDLMANAVSGKFAYTIERLLSTDYFNSGKIVLQTKKESILDAILSEPDMIPLILTYENVAKNLLDVSFNAYEALIKALRTHNYEFINAFFAPEMAQSTAVKNALADPFVLDALQKTSMNCYYFVESFKSLLSARNRNKKLIAKDTT